MISLPLSFSSLSCTLSISDTSSSYKSPLATISADGWVHTSSRYMLTSTCKLDLQLFPFDKQNCTFSFGSMSSSGELWHINVFIWPVWFFFLKRSTCNFLLSPTHRWHHNYAGEQKQNERLSHQWSGLSDTWRMGGPKHWCHRLQWGQKSFFSNFSHLHGKKTAEVQQPCWFRRPSFTTFLTTVSDRNGQETSSLRGQFHRAPLLPVGPRLGLLLHQRGQGGKVGFQDHHPVVHLRLAADPEGHPSVHGRQIADDRWVLMSGLTAQNPQKLLFLAFISSQLLCGHLCPGGDQCPGGHGGDFLKWPW